MRTVSSVPVSWGPAMTVVPTSKADINQRVIRLLTPAGKDELIDQFKDPR